MSDYMQRSSDYPVLLSTVTNGPCTSEYGQIRENASPRLPAWGVGLQTDSEDPLATGSRLNPAMVGMRHRKFITNTDTVCVCVRVRIIYRLDREVLHLFVHT
jgi:hypothetical protein